MNILLNGQALSIEGVTPEVTLAELVDTVTEELKESGATIMEIAADDIRISIEQTDELETRRLVEFETIDILTATARDLLEMALGESEEIFGFIDESARNVAADLRNGKVKEAMERHLETLDGLEWLSSILKHLVVGFAAEMSETSIEPRRKQLFDRLAAQMAELQKAQEHTDWVGLADVLEYEIPEITAEGRTLFADLRELVPDAGEPENDDRG
ncbi:MAG TPA: hypothetical protein PLP29_13800 [Candidatus Ozemobacteraceae bacterium]|nr:hypothetical protein [Candidatus Ozemobacteraceae bacterium]